MMNLTKEIILKTISEHKLELESRFGVKNLYLFGSYSREEQKEDSDIDFIVEYEKKQKARVKLQLAIYLKNLFGKEVDIGEKEEIKEDYRSSILNENLLKC